MILRRAKNLEEIGFYEDEAGREDRRVELLEQLQRVGALGQPWNEPSIFEWIDYVFDAAAQADAYTHVAPRLVGGAVLQLGGTGREVLKAILGGALTGILVTPVQGEADLTMDLAIKLGIASKIRTVVAMGEQTTLPDESVDVVLSGGCLHHTDVPIALAEVRRILRPGGRFAAWDPWHARLYDIGTAIFGKREPGIECRPLDPERLGQLAEVFPQSEVRLHGALTRYPLLVAYKARMLPSVKRAFRITEVDDLIAAKVGALGRNGSSAAVLATK